MNILPLGGVAAVAGMLLSFPAAAEDANPVGVWKLVSMSFVNLDTGEVTRPWGANPAGHLHYTAKGRMGGVITADPKDRKPALPGSEKVAEERAALFLNSAAYSGTWSVVGGTVTHKVEVSMDPSWVGTDQVRYLKLDKNELTIDD